MGNYRPEIIALATLIMSFIMKMCTHFNITVDASDAVQISALVAWLVSRALRKFLPDENAKIVQQIKDESNPDK